MVQITDFLLALNLQTRLQQHQLSSVTFNPFSTHHTFTHIGSPTWHPSVATLVVHTIVLFIAYSAIKHQEKLMELLMSDNKTQVGAGAGIAGLLAVGWALFGPVNLAAALSTVVSWFLIVILTEISFVLKLWTLLWSLKRRTMRLMRHLMSKQAVVSS
jgi:hypothetical protein